MKVIFHLVKSRYIIPTGVMYIASYLEKFSEFDNLSLVLEPQKIIAEKPDVVGISSVTETFNEAINIARAIKEELPKTKIIIGGAHISAAPSTLPSYFDAGVMGEGEETTLDVLNLIKEKEFYPARLKDIEGITFHGKDGKVVVNNRRKWVDNLDSLPPPKRSLANNLGIKLQQMLITARGCSFKCKYCASSQFWEKLRFHSPERVLQEMTEIISNFPDQKDIMIADDIFTINKNRLRTLVGHIREAGIHKKVNFLCNSRAAIFDEEVCELLIKMNVKHIGFGFESNSQQVLTYLKGAAKVQQNMRAVDICERHDMSVQGNFIIGSPTETVEDLAKTYWFCSTNRHTIMNFNVTPATPLPNTSFWTYAVENKIIDPENFDQWYRMPLGYNADYFFHMNEHYSREDLKEFFNEFKILGFDRKPLPSERYISKEYKNLYFKNMYKKTFAVINNDKNIKNLLEISIVKRIDDITESDIDFMSSLNTYKKINVNSSGRVDLETVLKDAETEQTDTVFLNHCLEYIRDIKGLFLQLQNLKDLKRIVLLSYNVKNMAMISDLIYGNLDNYKFGLDKDLRFHHFSSSTIKELLQNYGYEVLNITENIELPEELKKTWDSLIKIFRNKSEMVSPLFESNIVSYLITADKINN